MSPWFRALAGAAITSMWLASAVAAAGSGGPVGSSGWAIPDSAPTELSPLAGGGAAVVANGQRIYRAKCHSCHGADGRGHGPDSDPAHPAGDLTDGRAAARNPDGVLFYKIWNGRAKPKMPAMKLDLTRDDVWMVVAYVKTLRK